jgi:ubiquinone/menaquinone biosynthesis C-methylase UbiE
MQEQQASPDTSMIDQAVQRLLKQGWLLNSFTRRMLEDAGLTAGMDVLDLGCGPGDVSLMAAELVGAGGSVRGIDTNPAALRLAAARAKAAGFTHVSFQTCDVRALTLEQDYDAIVGRLILQYLPERASLLHRLAQHLRPGGVVAFQEYDRSPDDPNLSYPLSSLAQQVWRWLTQALQQGGVELQMGLHLYRTFLEAGLPAPQLRCEAAIGAGPEWVGYEVLAETVRSVLPLLVKGGIASVEDVDIETLADRLRAEIVSHQGTARSPFLVSAWVRKP